MRTNNKKNTSNTLCSPLAQLIAKCAFIESLGKRLCRGLTLPKAKKDIFSNFILCPCNFFRIRPTPITTYYNFVITKCLLALPSQSSGFQQKENPEEDWAERFHTRFHSHKGSGDGRGSPREKTHRHMDESPSPDNTNV